MRITLGTITDLLLSDVSCPYASISVEEALICCQTILLTKRTEFGGILVSSPSHLQATVISQILTQCQTTITFDVKVWVKTSAYIESKYVINESILAELNNVGVVIPFNQLDVHIVDSKA